jgi:exodeoxyribonuclease VII large subunit
VTGFRRSGRFASWELVEHGHDASEVRAVLCVGAFAREFAEIAAVLAGAGVELADGLEVTLWGRLDPNPAYGRLRLLAEGADPRTSVGAAVLAREQVMAELEASGQLRAQQALPTPAGARRVGLVSSPAAAGRVDVLAVLARSTVPFEVVEASAAMGGPHAPREVARALGILATSPVDLILVARGGGARSDLAAWDSPELARAIARCRVPVWVALGHARDRTVADMAAQRSFPAPSAAAAALVAEADAAAQSEQAAATASLYRAQLSRSRHRARWAVGVAVLAVVILVLMLMASGASR